MSIIMVHDTATEVEVLAISETEWRIRDNRLPAADATSLIGFIGLMGTAFEVTRLVEPLSRSYFASFGEALEFLAMPIDRHRAR